MITTDVLKVDARLDDHMSGKLKGLAGGIGSLGAKLGMLGSLGGISAIFGGAGGIAGLLMGSRAVGSYAEELENLSASTGLSTTKLQELRYAANIMGLDFERVTRGVGMIEMKMMGMEKETGNASDAMKRLGIPIHGTHGELRSMGDLFVDVIGKLQGVRNATERNMLAAQLFGRGWRELAPLIAMPAEELARLTDEAHKASAVLSGEALMKAKKFDDEVDRMEERLKAMGRVLLIEAIPYLEKFIKWITEGIPKLQKFIDKQGGLAGILKEVVKWTRIFVSLWIGLKFAEIVGWLLKMAKAIKEIGIAEAIAGLLNPVTMGAAAAGIAAAIAAYFLLGKVFKGVGGGEPGTQGPLWVPPSLKGLLAQIAGNTEQTAGNTKAMAEGLSVSGGGWRTKQATAFERFRLRARQAMQVNINVAGVEGPISAVMGNVAAQAVGQFAGQFAAATGGSARYG
jgi:hypothetical protein